MAGVFLPALLIGQIHRAANAVALCAGDARERVHFAIEAQQTEESEDDGLLEVDQLNGRNLDSRIRIRTYLIQQEAVVRATAGEKRTRRSRAIQLHTDLNCDVLHHCAHAIVQIDGPRGDQQLQLCIEPFSAERSRWRFINGVPISSATNTLTSVLDGLTLRLGQVTTADVDLIVERDNVAVRNRKK